MAPSMILKVRLPAELLDAPELARREPVGMERAIEHLETSGRRSRDRPELTPMPSMSFPATGPRIR